MREVLSRPADFIAMGKSIAVGEVKGDDAAYRCRPRAVLQIDDPSLPDNWDMINPEPPLREFNRLEQVRMEAPNNALRDWDGELICRDQLRNRV